MTQRLVYICTATSAGIVNVLPLLHLGLDRLAALIILVGAAENDPRKATDGERSEALLPAERLQQFVRERGVTTERIEPICHDPNDDLWWQETVRALFDRFVDHDISVNITGGPRGMLCASLLGALGAIGAPSRPNRSLRFHVYRGGPARVVEMWPNAGGEQLLDKERLSLDEYLRLNGLEGLDGPDATAQRRERAGRARVLEALWNWVRANSTAHIRRGRIRFLPRLGQAIVAGKTAELRFSDRGMLASLVQRSAGALAPIGLAGGPSRPTTDERRLAQKLLGGAWLEELLALRLDRIFAGADVQVIQSLRVRYTDAVESKSDVAEIDVVVFDGAQLHFVECKAKNYVGKRNSDGSGKSSGIKHANISQLVELRRRLVGPQGLSFIYNLQPKPSIKEAPEDAAHFEALRVGATQNGIGFVVNIDGLLTIEEAFRKVLRRG